MADITAGTRRPDELPGRADITVGLRVPHELPGGAAGLRDFVARVEAAIEGADAVRTALQREHS